MNSNNENSVDPYEEVKKLQSLVQKLEYQNEQLKNQVKEEKTKVSKDRRSKSLSGFVLDNGMKQLNLSPFNFETNGLNPNMEEFIDIDQLELSDDDSWLYMPPKGLTTEEVSLNPYKWLRKDLEDPKNKELQLAKSALVNKLEELSILSPPNQEQEQFNENVSENVIPADQTRIIDTRTFTRSKKKNTSKEELNNKTLSLIEPVVNNEQNGVIDDDDSNYEFGYIRPELYQLSDFIDVHEKARMQEESLRQSTPVISVRGTCSLPRTKKLPNSKIKAPRSSSSDTEDSYANNIENVKKYVRRPMTSTPAANTVKTFNSTHSSPLGSNSSLNTVTAPSSLRRSLPNLAKNNVNRRSTSVKSVNNSSNNLKPNRQQNIQFPNQARRESAPSPSFRKPILQEPHSYSANAISVQNPPSIHKSNLLPSNRGQNRSGLPRPSKLPAPRPKLPVPLYQPKKTQVEESWSDGCF